MNEGLPEYSAATRGVYRSAAAMLPPSTVTTAPLVLVAFASETKACATSWR